MNKNSLSFTHTALRYLAIGGLPALLMVLFAWAGGWLTPSQLSAKSLVEVIEQGSGVHPGFRRNHAKGICVVGEFVSNGRASALSEATVFQKGVFPVIGRLAIAGGNPHAPDYGVPVRSFALEFRLPKGEQWRSGMNALPFFNVSTPQGFYALQVATRPDPATGKPNPQKVAEFLTHYPEAKPFFQWAKNHVLAASWAEEQYNSLNAFRFTNAENQSQYVRWSLVPHTPWQPISAAQQQDSNYLTEDMNHRLQQGPVVWDLLITLAQPGDPIDDATKAWPEDRQTLIAGSVVIHRSEAQQGGDCNNINYDPLILPKGISGSSDPLLSARSAAYAKSYHLRTSEEAHSLREKKA